MIAKRNVPLAVHACVVALLIGVFAVMAAQPVIGANIGAGLVLLVIMALGLPWSLPFWVDPGNVLLQIAPAVLNVVVHAVIRSAVRRLRA
jgi:hypothetical protein